MNLRYRSMGSIDNLVSDHEGLHRVAVEQHTNLKFKGGSVFKQNGFWDWGCGSIDHNVDSNGGEPDTCSGFIECENAGFVISDDAKEGFLNNGDNGNEITRDFTNEVVLYSQNSYNKSGLCSTLSNLETRVSKVASDVMCLGTESVISGRTDSSGMVLKEDGQPEIRSIYASIAEDVMAERRNVLVEPHGDDSTILNGFFIEQTKEEKSCFPNEKETEAAIPDSVLSYSRSCVQSESSSRGNIASRRRASNRQQSLECSDFVAKTRRKRSCLFKPRSSLWGSPGNIKLFCQSNELPSHQPLNQYANKSKADRSDEKSKKSISESLHISRKDQPSTGRLRLKVKFGKANGQCSMNDKVEELDDGVSAAGSKLGDHGTELDPRSRLDCPNNSKCLDKLEHVGIMVGESGVATDNGYMGAGTSPDSEVINTVPEALASTRHEESLSNSALYTLKSFDATGVIDKKKGKKGKKIDNRPCKSSSVLKDSSLATGSIDKSKPMKNSRGKQNMDHRSSSNEVNTSPTCPKYSSKSYKDEISIKQLPQLRETELGDSGDALRKKSCPEIDSCFVPRVDPLFKQSQVSIDLLPFAKGQQFPKNLISDGVRKELSDLSDSPKSQGGNDCGHNENKQKSINKINDCELDAGDQAVDSISGGAVEDSEDGAWVSCDDCHKWRRIPVSFVETLSGNCRWICKDNLDTAFADCSIAQEMSNEEINEELGISNVEADAYDNVMNKKGKDKGSQHKRVPGFQKACFRGIKINRFLHRNRKALSIDEIMVCNCKPPPDGKKGCGDECLNRILNVECIPGTCPCGDLCSNQQFQQRKYAKLDCFKSGKKGYGLRVLEGLRQGQFLIEYVGEVLDVQSYEARQKEYAANGQKHFYFMTLNGNEVIDAATKGNLGRFINHSCNPNCRTEKWMVNGEICIGIFALKDINKEEEVTFDYNYVRAFGAAAKKCYCGAQQCQGYIGGDPLDSEIVVQSDSDGEYSEPLMVEDDETGDCMMETTSSTSSLDGAETEKVRKGLKELHTSKVTSCRVGAKTEIGDTKGLAPTIPLLHGSVETGDSECKILLSPQLREDSLLPENVTSEPLAAVHPDIMFEGNAMDRAFSSSQTLVTLSPTVGIKSSSDDVDSKKKTTSSIEEDKQVASPKSHPLMKTSKLSSNKKGKRDSHLPDGNKTLMIVANKSQVQCMKSKILTEGPPGGRTDTVEGKLNELLDDDGGISKRKDSTKVYLKLLLLTAASRGNPSNEGIQSNRDLSMILDAILKTKSRGVLTDIINKNGLQMLHNIMKQYRRDFRRIPILRKLLKILEYLAARKILLLEHITRGPPCAGMESFKDSVLSLTEHDDKQVHQIARNFRDKWIPRHFRKHVYMDRDAGRVETLRGSNNSRFSASHGRQHDHAGRSAEPTDRLVQAKLATTSSSASAQENRPETCANVPQTNIRKRKSRWDQPARARPQFTDSGQLVTRDKNDEATSPDSKRQNSNIQDIPPGFSSPVDRPSVARSEEKFISRLPASYGIPLTVLASYGIPLTVLQQFGTYDSKAWAIAPGVPFSPFPPLPLFPKDKKHPSAASAGANQVDADNIQHLQEPTKLPPFPPLPPFKRTRGSSFDIENRYSKQQKREVPPWFRNGRAGCNFKGRTGGVEVPNSFSPQDVNNNAYQSGHNFHHGQ